MFRIYFQGSSTKTQNNTEQILTSRKSHHSCLLTQSTWAVEYTDCISEER